MNGARRRPAIFTDYPRIAVHAHRAARHRPQQSFDEVTRDRTLAQPANLELAQTLDRHTQQPQFCSVELDTTLRPFTVPSDPLK